MLQRGYKPDGWLGMILGAKLFIDFSGKYPFEKKWAELAKQLHGKVKQGMLKPFHFNFKFGNLVIVLLIV